MQDLIMFNVILGSLLSRTQHQCRFKSPELFKWLYADLPTVLDTCRSSQSISQDSLQFPGGGGT